jgi:hypothetical protein
MAAYGFLDWCPAFRLNLRHEPRFIVGHPYTGSERPAGSVHSDRAGAQTLATSELYEYLEYRISALQAAPAADNISR